MELDARKQKILGAVIRDYVETVKPIGSEELAARHDLGVKSATIRNELAELADLGYLKQPHTSAGRIPSDRGYRFYVDNLLDPREIEPAAVSIAEDSRRLADLDQILRHACVLLSRMTSYTSVATPPQPDYVCLTQAHVSPAGDNRLLIVLVLSDGHVENRLLTDTQNSSPPQAFAIATALTERLGGKTLVSIANAPADNPLFDPPRDFEGVMRMDYESVARAVRTIAQAITSSERIFLEGLHAILRQPEFRDVTKIESFLVTFQQSAILLQTFSRALSVPSAMVVIGEENHIAAMHECSVVTASYYIGARERGTIGVVGPTRMDYDRTVPAVNFFARSLTETLSAM
jgi:heat-inducible transcriptional repressor